MDYNIKNILQVAGIVCSSFAFADSSMDSSNDQGTATSSIPSSEITPPAGFAAQQGMGFSLYADFIYYQARQTGQAFAYTDGDSTYQGQYYFPLLFDYCFRFRVNSFYSQNGYHYENYFL